MTIRINEANLKATGCPETILVLREVGRLSLSFYREVKNPVIGIPEANFLDLSRTARRNLVNPCRDW